MIGVLTDNKLSLTIKQSSVYGLVQNSDDLQVVLGDGGSRLDDGIAVVELGRHQEAFSASTDSDDGVAGLIDSQGVKVLDEREGVFRCDSALLGRTP